MSYAKFIFAVAMAVVGAVSLSMTGDAKIDPSEWVNVAIAGVGALAVYLGPNVPGVANTTKLIMAGLAAGLMALSSYILDGVSISEWGQIAMAVVGAIGVFLVPNSNA